MANKLDGRRARGMRTRAAIIDSLLELVGEGDLSPTAQRIADRAGVSVRSVYQHFNDVEGLFTEAADRARKNAEELREPIDPGLPLDERVDRFVAVRSAILEELRAFIRAARLVEPSSDELRKYRVKLEKDARDELGRVFGRELSKADGATRRRAGQRARSLEHLVGVGAPARQQHQRPCGSSDHAPRDRCAAPRHSGGHLTLSAGRDRSAGRRRVAVRR